MPFIRDPLGRPGVGVAWTLNDVTFTLVFNAKTYRYLGLSQGFPHGGSAIEKIAIVDRVGDLPR